MLATFTSMLLVSMTLAQPDDPPPPPPPPGPPGPADVKVEWAPGYPKTEAGKLKLKGKVTFANGWSSPNNKILLFEFKAGATNNVHVKDIDLNGTWEGEVDLKTYPMPQQTYTFVPLAEATNDKGANIFPVAGPRKTMELP